MATWGGKRPNSGRKIGQVALRRQIELKARDRLVARVYKNWDKLLDVKFRAAIGDYYIEEITNAKGAKERRVVYKGLPDQKAATELLEFTIGKARQGIDATIDGEVDVPGIDKLAEGIKSILEGKAGKKQAVKVPQHTGKSQSNEAVQSKNDLKPSIKQPEEKKLFNYPPIPKPPAFLQNVETKTEFVEPSATKSPIVVPDLPSNPIKQPQVASILQGNK